MTSEDVSYVKKAMNGRTKTLIGEFNTFGSPTSLDVRKELYELYNVTWSGWIGRYFEEFGSEEVPAWVKSAYKKQYNKEWNLTGKGLLFVNESNKLVIITEKELKENPVWFQYTKQGKKTLNLQDESAYQYWFDVITPHQKVMCRLSLSFTWILKGKIS